MSFDLEVIAGRQPKAANIAAFVAANGLVLEGTLKTRGSVLIHDAAGTAAEVDGPNRLDRDDVPDAANGAIGRSGWLLQISAKGDASWPSDLAIHLARIADGVVLDQQDDKVTWPPSWRPTDPGTGVQRVDRIQVSWFFNRPADVGSFMRGVVEELIHQFPEAKPKRFGTYEPLQGRFAGRESLEVFIRTAMEAARTYTTLVFWTAEPPCRGGEVAISSLKKFPPGHDRATIHAGVAFDGYAFDRAPSFTDRFVQGFATIASRFESVYAAAWVERDWELRRGRMWSGAGTESGPLPRADHWVGLPASPTWLAWFGRPYAALVRDVVAGQIAAESPAGIMLRVGDEPQDASALSTTFPTLPLHLIARRPGEAGSWLAGVRYGLTAGPPSQPAEFIPPLA